MITRRNIRTKVVHTIFEQQIQDSEHSSSHSKKSLEWRFQQTEALHSAIWHLLIQLCDYVLIDANIRSSKRLPSYEDLNVNIKLADNVVLQQLKKNTKLSDSIKQHKLAHLFDEEFIRTLFNTIRESDYYLQYLRIKDRQPLAEKKILEDILLHAIYENEVANSLLSGIYLAYDTDIDMLHSWIDKILLSAGSFSFNKLVTVQKYQYAFDLLETYEEKKNFTKEIISPNLLNWDPERVAMLDFIILQLGVCEMLYFESIPLKVTINEYIDIAKTYSGQQSGQFVNGILDSIRKELEASGKIHKTEFKSVKN
jgi:transcription antitermination protein NusB